MQKAPEVLGRCARWGARGVLDTALGIARCTRNALKHSDTAQLHDYPESSMGEKKPGDGNLLLLPRRSRLAARSAAFCSCVGLPASAPRALRGATHRARPNRDRRMQPELLPSHLPIAEVRGQASAWPFATRKRHHRVAVSRAHVSTSKSRRTQRGGRRRTCARHRCRRYAW